MGKMLMVNFAHTEGLQRPFRMDSMICGSHYEQDLRREENNARGVLDEERRRGGKGGELWDFPPLPLPPLWETSSPNTLAGTCFSAANPSSAGFCDYSLLGSFGDSDGGGG